MALAALYALVIPWMMDDDEKRLWLPAGALILAGFRAFAGRWLRPTGFAEATIDALTAGLWRAMALSWLAWLAWRGIAFSGRLGALGIAGATACCSCCHCVSILRSLGSPMSRSSSCSPPIEAVRSCVQLLRLLRGVPPLSWLWPLPAP